MRKNLLIYIKERNKKQWAVAVSIYSSVSLLQKKIKNIMKIQYEFSLLFKGKILSPSQLLMGVGI